jgi:hypothetical protein
MAHIYMQDGSLFKINNFIKTCTLFIQTTNKDESAGLGYILFLKTNLKSFYSSNY